MDLPTPEHEHPPAPPSSAPGPGPRHARRLALGVVVAVVGLDRVTKAWATSALAGQAGHVLWGGSVRLVYVENTGAFLSLGADWSPAWRFTLLTLGCSFTLLALMGTLLAQRKALTHEVMAWALVLGGGLGNVIDRLARDGRVIDFVQLSLGTLHTGVFNVADVALMAGAVWLLLGLLGGERARDVATSAAGEQDPASHG